MDHSNCSHPKTKAGRAACRRSQGKPTRPRPEGQAKKGKRKAKEPTFQADDVIARRNNGTLDSKYQGAMEIHTHPENYTTEEVGKARQLLFGR